MRFYTLLFVVLFFQYGFNFSGSERFSLSDKQKANGLYLEHEADDIAKVMHPVYGYLKHVKLTAPDISASKVAKQSIQILDLSKQLSAHYSRVLDELENNKWHLAKVCSEEYLVGMKTGLQYWIDGGNAGNLKWGILHFQKG